MSNKKEIDWIGIEKEYRAGQLSLREIARQYGVNEKTIRNRRDAENWGPRALAKRVRKEVQEKLIRKSAVRDSHAHAREDADLPTDEESIEEAAERTTQVIELQRKDIAALRKLEQKFMGFLHDVSPESTQEIRDYAQALHNFANVQHKRITLERQAYNLNDNNDYSTLENPLEALLDKIDGKTANLVDLEAEQLKSQ